MTAFFNVIDIETAIGLSRHFSPVSHENVTISAAPGRIIATDIVADAPLAPFSRSTMDGYALRAADTFGASAANPAFMRLVDDIGMGQVPEIKLQPGQAASIATGGMLPAGADAVVMVEYSARLDAETIEIYKSAAPGLNVILAGEDYPEKASLVIAGQALRAQEIGLLAAFGRAQIPVFRQPRTGLISTGDEIVPIDQHPKKGRIRDVNTHSLSAQIIAGGGVPRCFGIVKDEFSSLNEKLAQAIDACDMVLISGGSSVGTRDFTTRAISAQPHSQVLAHGISISPGKPTIIADVGGKPVFGLPGHVTSAMVVFTVVVMPFLRRLAGWTDVQGKSRIVPARLNRNLSAGRGRDHFIRVRLEEDGGDWQAVPVLGKSGLINTMVRADGLIRIPKESEGLMAGSQVRVALF